MKRTACLMIAALMLLSSAACAKTGAPMSYEQLMRCEKNYMCVDGDWPKSFEEMWSKRVSAVLASGRVKSVQYTLGWEHGISGMEYEIEITSVWDGGEPLLAGEELEGMTVKALCYDHIAFADEEKMLEFVADNQGKKFSAFSGQEEEIFAAELVPTAGTEYVWWFEDYELPMKPGEEYAFLLTMIPGYSLEEPGVYFFHCSYISPVSEPLEKHLEKLGMLEGFKMKGDDHMLEIAEEIRKRVKD